MEGVIYLKTHNNDVCCRTYFGILCILQFSSYNPVTKQWRKESVSVNKALGKRLVVVCVCVYVCVCNVCVCCVYVCVCCVRVCVCVCVCAYKVFVCLLQILFGSKS